MREMKILHWARMAAALAIAAAWGLAGPLSAGAMKVVSDKAVTGFRFPESVGYDAQAKVLYIGNFGSELKPLEKDGKGYISRVSLDGKILEERWAPAHGETLHKPKGMWVRGDRLWTTDVDAVVIFDTKTKKSKRVTIPGIQFANDPAILGDTLYVSDNRGDALYSVTPADFLNSEPKVAQVWSGKNINPNGIYPAKDGSLLLVGFKSDKEPKGIYAMKPGQDPKALSQDLGRLDGVYELDDGSLLVTDWNTGSLFQWSAKGGMTPLAKDFKGPADFAAWPNAGGVMVAVPDLVKSEVRFIQLGP